MAKRRTNKETQEGLERMKDKDWRLVIDLLLVLGLIWLLYMISQ